MRDTIGPIVLAVAVVIAIVFGLHSCAESRRRSFRDDCKSQGGEVTAVMLPEGEIALACQPAGTTSPVLIVPHPQRTKLAPGRSP
jgi:hypothetical protein